MDDFKSNKKQLDQELDRFISLLGELLPRYHELLEKENLSQDELKNLGEIENYLLGVNAKIIEIKKQLEQDLFGQSLSMYYQLKNEAIEGNANSKLKLEKLRDVFVGLLNSGEIINYN